MAEAGTKVTKAPKLKYCTGEAIRALRKKRNMNQVDFWSRIGITQSGGSRYESGRNIPMVVVLMIEVAYGSGSESAKLLEYLRGNQC